MYAVSLKRGVSVERHGERKEDVLEHTLMHLQAVVLPEVEG
jgi:hypothetical protein